MHVARLPAIRAIVKTVNAKTNILLRLTKAAVLIASALRFRLFTHRTNRRHLEWLSRPKLWCALTIVGHVRTADKQLATLLAPGSALETAAATVGAVP